MKVQEKRKYIRLKAYHLVKYRVLSDKGERHPSIVASIKDIGAGGVCLKTEEYLPVASLLELSINFPNITTSVFASARVAWIKPIKKTKRFEVGCQFVEISDSLRVIIDEQIKSVWSRFKAT